MAFVDNWVVGKEKVCYWLSMITSSNDGQSSEIAESSLVDKSGDCSVLETNK